MYHNRASQAEGKIQNTATFSSGGERYVAGGTLPEFVIINLCAVWADAGSAESHICDRLMMHEVARAVDYHRVKERSGISSPSFHSLQYLGDAKTPNVGAPSHRAAATSPRALFG